MPKPKNTTHGEPKRSESLTRMLELEKQYKMQRIQDNGPTPHTPQGSPSTRPPPSAQPDSGVKARRASEHPPLSYQNKIMKAVRRSSGLPSLSISIPPSPKQAVVVRTDGYSGYSDQEAAPALEHERERREHPKTVKFSDPEEESDASSICQSPSWEGWGQNKKKAKKKEAERKKKEREEKAKKKQSRLSKAPRQDEPGLKPLTASDRSAASFDALQKLTERSSNRTTNHHYPPDTMNNHQQVKTQLNGVENAKPRAKSFLSGFRLQHGNVSAVQKMMTTPRASMDDPPLRSAPPTQQSHATGLGVDFDFANPRKAPNAPSVTSNVSASTHSSQDRRPGLGRASASGSGRSQSFLSRLKGPSYLYHQTADSGDNVSNQHATTSKQIEAPVPQTEAQRPRTSYESTRVPPPFAVPALRAPNSDTKISRGRQPEAHVPAPRDPSSDYGEESNLQPPEPRGRQSSAMVPDMPVANEGRRRPQSYVDHVRQQFADTDSPSLPHPLNDYTELNRNQYEAQRLHQQLEQTREQAQYWREPVYDRGGKSGSSRSDYAFGYKDEVDQLSATHSPHGEDDTSTIRPISHGKDRAPMEKGRNPPSSALSPKSTLPGTTSNHHRQRAIREEQPELVEVDKSAPDQHTQKLNPDHQTEKTERSSDYFSFISESYAPPSLELRSPMERFPSSPRIDEEPDEDVNEQLNWTKSPPRNVSHEGSSYTTNATVSTKVTPAGRTLHGSKPQFEASPAMSAKSVATHSDSDVPAFERLGIPAKAAKILGTSSNSLAAPSGDNHSRSTSERSSSTYDEGPPSPSTATTPASSRPQSRKGISADIPRNAVNGSSHGTEDKKSRKSQRPTTMDYSSVSKPRSTCNRDERSNLAAFDIDHNSAGTTFTSRDGLLSSPALISTPTSVTFADELKEEMDGSHKQNLPPKAQSAIDLPSTSFLPPLKHKPLHAKKTKSKTSPTLLPSPPPPDLEELHPPRTSSLAMSRNNSSSSQDSTGLVSAGAAYLQEARKSAPVPSANSTRALRPILSHKNALPPARSALSPERKGEPIAKMLVECCSCKFFHDMPSRVYECMAKPDSVVEDKLLGVSAAISTTVRCPWCGHGMTTQCCSGYAAMVYLKEKLHGK